MQAGEAQAAVMVKMETFASSDCSGSTTMSVEVEAPATIESCDGATVICRLKAFTQSRQC